MSRRVEIARGPDEIARLEETWRRVRWGGEQAEFEYFTALTEDAWPLAVLVLDGDEPVAAAAGRFRPRRLSTSFGYRDIYAPEVRSLELVSGGVVATGAEDAKELADALWSVLAGPEADVLAVPALPIDSPVFAAFAGLGGPLERQRFIPTWTRRRLVLPESFDSFLSSRTRKIRAGIRYDSKKLVETLGPTLSVTIRRDAEDFDALVERLEHVARETYQRALDAGFADTPQQRRLTQLALEHGWLRAYVLEHDAAPIAYWLCSVHSDTITLKTTGYLPSYAHLRPGIYLLMRVIEDACTDPQLRVLDFGPGRSDYKRHFSSEGYLERNVLVFAPSLRPRRINAVRSGILGGAALARRALDATGATTRLRTAWRDRLRTSK